MSSSRTTALGELLGLGTQDVQAAVNADLAAHRQGPDAFTRALAAAPRDELLARYDATCARINYDAAQHNRTAGYSTAAAAQGDEDRQVRRGGNR